MPEPLRVCLVLLLFSPGPASAAMASPLIGISRGAAAAGAPAAAVMAAALSAAAPTIAPSALSAAVAGLPALASGLTPEPAATAPAAVKPGAQSGRPAAERASLEAGRRFDGTSAAAAGWSRGTFESADGLDVSFKRRAGPAGTVPRVYSGGLSVAESFEALFARSAAPARPEFFLWTRGHRPTGWTETQVPLDADARDLARMIVLAARETGAPKVELALHSFGTAVFQRMVQLHAETDVAAALKLLSGSRVVLVNATTHFEDSISPVPELIGRSARQWVDNLDVMDQGVKTWKAAAALNPFLSPSIGLWTAGYRVNRALLMSLATRSAAEQTRKDLSAPWDPAIDPIRLAFLSALKKNANDPGWQESLLRRSSGLFRLDFTEQDVERVRRLGIKLELIHSAGDKLLTWENTRAMFERFGIPAPKTLPAPGTALPGSDGLFRATIVNGDHYYPLKRRDDLARRLDPPPGGPLKE